MLQKQVFVWGFFGQVFFGIFIVFVEFDFMWFCVFVILRVLFRVLGFQIWQQFFSFFFFLEFVWCLLFIKSRCLFELFFFVFLDVRIKVGWFWFIFFLVSFWLFLFYQLGFWKFFLRFLWSLLGFRFFFFCYLQVVGLVIFIMCFRRGVFFLVWWFFCGFFLGFWFEDSVCLGFRVGGEFCWLVYFQFFFFGFMLQFQF